MQRAAPLLLARRAPVPFKQSRLLKAVAREEEQPHLRLFSGYFCLAASQQQRRALSLPLSLLTSLSDAPLLPRLAGNALAHR